LEDDVRFEYVILLEQQSAAEVRREAQAEAQAEARAAAAQARAEAQAAAQEARVEAQKIREEAQQIREQVRQQIRIEQGHGFGQGVGEGQGGDKVIMVPSTPPFPHNDIPPNVVELVSMLAIALVICIVGLPIARAIGRWIDRRGLPGPSINAELGAQMNRIEQAVDTMAVEVERISEAQRFQAKLLSDRENVRA
jgi:hypothetical protein